AAALIAAAARADLSALLGRVVAALRRAVAAAGQPGRAAQHLVGSRAAARARDRFLLLAHRRVEIPERTVELVFLRAARRGIAAGAVRTFLGPLAGRRAAFAFGAGARPGRALVAGAAVGRTARGAGPALVTGLPGR